MPGRLSDEILACMCVRVNAVMHTFCIRMCLYACMIPSVCVYFKFMVLQHYHCISVSFPKVKCITYNIIYRYVKFGYLFELILTTLMCTII